MTKSKTFAALQDALDLSGAEDAATTSTLQLVGSGTLTITFEASIDGTNFVALQFVNLNSGTAGTTATAAGVYRANTTGLRHVRARCSAYTSGNLVGTGTIASGT